MNQDEKELLESEKLITVEDYMNLFKSLVELTASGNKEIKEAINDVALNLKLKVAYIIAMSQPYITRPGFWARLKERRAMKKQEKLLKKMPVESDKPDDDVEQRLNEQGEMLKKIENALQTKDFSSFLADAPKVPQIAEQSDSADKSNDVLKF